MSTSDTKATGVIRVISGAQTGVDRAALDVAMELGYQHGGWVPRGRRAEDGRLDYRYKMQETRSWKYHTRTRYNVRDSDGTLILHDGPISGGTELTRQLAHQAGKPHMLVDFDDNPDPLKVQAWLRENNIVVLNVAGPRASTLEGVYGSTYRFLTDVLK